MKNVTWPFTEFTIGALPIRMGCGCTLTLPAGKMLFLIWCVFARRHRTISQTTPKRDVLYLQQKRKWPIECLVVCTICSSTALDLFKRQVIATAIPAAAKKSANTRRAHNRTPDGKRPYASLRKASLGSAEKICSRPHSYEKAFCQFSHTVFPGSKRSGAERTRRQRKNQSRQDYGQTCDHLLSLERFVGMFHDHHGRVRLPVDAPRTQEPNHWKAGTEKVEGGREWRSH